jgi:hypothetical protein
VRVRVRVKVEVRVRVGVSRRVPIALSSFSMNLMSMPPSRSFTPGL